MKSLLSYISKKYHGSVSDFYKEWEEGFSYWLTLKCDGKYHLVGYVSEYTIHEDTIKSVLEVLKNHITIKYGF